MRRLLLALLFCTAAALACPGNACGTGMSGYSASPLGTLHYALKIMELRDDPQIRLALQSYRSRVAAIPRGLETDAFKNGAFDRDMFLQKSGGTQRAEAQADLFEQVYAALDVPQRRELHRLMAAHQYYLTLTGSQAASCAPGSCPSKPSRNCP